jgi:hypothetical protein
MSSCSRLGAIKLRVVTLETFQENRVRKMSVGCVWTSARLDAHPQRPSVGRPRGASGVRRICVHRTLDNPGKAVGRRSEKCALRSCGL